MGYGPIVMPDFTKLQIENWLLGLELHEELRS
jgi:hypothetical protein